MRIFLFAIAALCMSACNFAGLEHDPDSVFDNQEAYQATAKVITSISENDIDAFDALASPDRGDMDSDAFRWQLKKFFEAIPRDDSLVIEHYYSELRQGEGEYKGIPVYLTAHDVVTKDKFAQLYVAVAPNDGECCSTTYWKITPSDVRPSKYFDFTFSHKGWTHYVIFALVILVPVFMIVTAVACFLNKSVTLKALWIPFILIGLWGVQFNWATGELQNQFFSFANGQFNVQIFKFQLLGVGFFKYGPFMPWIFSLGVPAGAIAYWLFPARTAREANTLLD